MILCFWMAADSLVHSWCTLRNVSFVPLFRQASRFQIIKVHVERTEVTEDKEGIEEMELAATNNNALEAWLSALEVSVMGDSYIGVCMIYKY